MIRALAGVVLLYGFAAPVAAQTPSPEQLQILEGLTPEQRQQVLEQLSSRDQSFADPESGSEGRQEVAPDATTVRRANTLPEPPVVPLLDANDTVLVQATLGNATGRDERELGRLEQLVGLIRARNPFQLDQAAQLNLPGFAPIALGGLTERQAMQRLTSDPALQGLAIQLVRLPVQPSGVNALKPFGYELFESAPSTFMPVTDVPVPADYVVGPGDEMNVQLFGSQNRTLRLVVNRDGAISLPELGPVRVGGLTFNAARQAIETQVQERLVGVQVSITMGETRAIRVFVLGEARAPGSYTVSGLATMTSALFASGGISAVGSLREIQLRRQGETVRRLDLYDLLLRGDTSNDAQLLPGDVIFIPPVGATVSIDGEVKRPAIYELRGDSSVIDLVQVAGGLTAEADERRASLTRINDENRRVVLDVDLEAAASSSLVLRNGDVLRVARLRPQLDSGVQLEGHVYRPGSFAWRQGLRLSEVVGTIDELKPNADLNYVLIRRESGPDRRLTVLSADLSAAFAAPGTAADPALEPRDRIIVFDLAPGRDRIVQPLLEELSLQADLSRPTEIVRVDGKVKVPGSYPLEPGMRVSDLLRAGGNLDASAYGAEAELARYTVASDGSRRTELIEVNLAAVRRGEAAANVALLPFDHLLIKETPDWGSQEAVTLRGEVRFPGTYPIRRGETLRELIERAGGLTSLAFPSGSAFTRRDLKELEQQQLDSLAERMRSDLAALALQAGNAAEASAVQALQAGQSLLSELKSAQATGRFVIDLPGLLAAAPGGAKDVLLRDGDELFIPKGRQEVSVIGEVQNATSHQYRVGLKRNDYVALSGGTTKKADRGRIYIVRADGSVAVRHSAFMGGGSSTEIKPGDTIVVPLDTERMPRLPLWQAVTQILYNVAVSIAAVNSF